MSPSIFISYRREDSQGSAGRLTDHLRLVHGFAAKLDVESIAVGTNFETAVKGQIEKCDFVLAVIGPRWLGVTSPSGSRRLDESDDPVRMEIVTALQLDKPIVPVLVEGASMPSAKDLPADISGFSLRNGVEVRHASFTRDADNLAERLMAETDFNAERGAVAHPAASVLPELPARFGSQTALEAYANNLTDPQFMALGEVLRSRGWTDAEITDRVQPLRPNVPLT